MFFEVVVALLLLLVGLLLLEEVGDEFVEAIVLVFLESFSLDLLLVVHELVVPVGLVDALVELHLAETLSAVQHVLVLIELSLQLLLLVILVVRVKHHARVVR